VDRQGQIDARTPIKPAAIENTGLLKAFWGLLHIGKVAVQPTSKKSAL
jgi:hypothetical protein